MPDISTVSWTSSLDQSSPWVITWSPGSWIGYFTNDIGDSSMHKPPARKGAVKAFRMTRNRGRGFLEIGNFPATELGSSLINVSYSVHTRTWTNSIKLNDNNKNQRQWWTWTRIISAKTTTKAAMTTTAAKAGHKDSTGTTTGSKTTWKQMNHILYEVMVYNIKVA